MQQRRGTAAQWISTNSGNGPILNAGEIGYETDTNKFKIGDGTNHWINLDYFIDANSTANPSFGTSITFEGATADAYETTLQVTDPTADRTITLPNATGTVVLADANGDVSISGNFSVLGSTTIIDSTILNVQTEVKFEGTTADAFETSLKPVDPTADRTIFLPDDNGNIILDTASQTLTNKTIAISSNSISGSIGDFNTALTGADFATLAGTETLTNKTLTSPNINEGVALTATATELNVLDGITSSTAELNILDGVTSTAAELNILDGVTATAAQINVLGSLTSSATELNILDGVVATTAELNYVSGVTSAIQTQLNNKQAIVTDVSDTEIGYLNGVTSAIQTQLNGKQATVLNVSDVEIGYLDGVTSSIQTQIDAKLATSTASSTYAPIASPTFTGTVTIPVGASISGFAPLESPTFTGTVVLPSTVNGPSISTSVNLLFPTQSGHITLGGSQTTGNLTLGGGTNRTTGVIGIGTGATTTGTKTINVGTGSTGGTTAITVGSSSGATSNITLNGEVTTSGNLTVGGDLTVSGTTTTVSTANFTTEDALIYLGEGNSANLVDLGFVSSFNDGTYQHSGLARDASDSKWKLFKGVTDEPTTTVNFAQGSLDALAVGALEVSSITSSGAISATTVTPSSGVVFTDGTQTLEGVPSRTPIIQKTASYTLSSLTERDDLIEMGSASAMTLTIPLNSAVAFPVGTSIDILQTSTGQVTIAGDAGVTVNSTPGLKLRTQWSTATLFKRATNTWVVYGDLTA